MPGRAERAHRVQPAVPVVEVADDADRARVRRPDRERRAAHAVDLAHVRAELLVQPLVPALAQARWRSSSPSVGRKRVRIVELDVRRRPGTRPRAGTRAAATPGDLALKRPAGCRRSSSTGSPPSGSDADRARRPAGTRARRPSCRRSRMRAEQVVRVGMVAPRRRCFDLVRTTPSIVVRLARAGARSRRRGRIPSRGGWPARSAARRPPSRARRSRSSRSVVVARRQEAGALRRPSR